MSYQKLIEKYAEVEKVRSELIGYNAAICEEDPSLPRAYIIGDSISISYTQPVRKLLEHKANVLRPPYNCKTSRFLRSKLEEIFSIGEVDVCSLNIGIHDTMSDRFVPIEEYEDNLRYIVKFINNRSKLFWVSSTMFFGPSHLRPLANSTLHEVYRSKSIEVMKSIGVEICDLDPLISSFKENEDVKPDGMHFWDHSYERMAELVAKKFKRLLTKKVFL
jgi:hypothetical protein